MGGSKAKAKPQKAARPTVPTKFDCMFCNHAQTVECKLNYNTNIGTIKCRVCDASYQMEINHLTDPIDVYSEWIDEAEKVNADGAAPPQEYGGDDGGAGDVAENGREERVKSRKAERNGGDAGKTASGYKRDEFIASEDDESGDELGIDED